MENIPGEHEKALSDYARPSVTVDTAVLTVDTMFNELCVALVESPTGERALPGTFLHENETLEQAAVRALREKVGIGGVSPVQFHVFDSLNRDPRGWVISVAHIAVVPFEQLHGVRLTPVSEAGKLAFDHNDMLNKAIERLRSDYAETPDPWNLLDTFTLKELREVHEAIDPDTPLRDSFRRMMQPLVVDTGVMSSGGVGKPSRVWRKETESERIMRKYAKYERPLTSPSRSRNSARIQVDSAGTPQRSLTSETDRTSPSERNYSLEIHWRSGDVTTHEGLSRSQAALRLKQFNEEMRAAWSGMPEQQKPKVARIVSRYGDTEAERIFD